jgi:osmotically-inducible protein OsmY
MRRYPKWVLTLGIVAVTPGLATAASFPFGKSDDADASASAPAAPQPKTTHNQKVAENIALALRKAQFHGYEIEIEYKDGVATLTGKVSDPRQKVKANQVVNSVPGVRRLDNRLAVVGARGAIRQVTAEAEAPAGPAAQAPAAGSGNQEKAMQIGRALESAGLNGYDIEILFQNGQAVLRGSVGSPEQVAGASRIAQSVPGVQSVANQLRVGQTPQQAGQQRDPRLAMAAYQQQAQMAQMQQAQMQGGRPPYYMAAQAGTPGAPLTPGVSPGAPGPGGPPMGPGGTLGAPMPATGPVPAGPVYDNPNIPEYAWPTYAQYPNYAAVTYPSQYSASAWPYIGPFYPYPQVPLNWRKVQLEWSDGHWDLKFDSRTDRWWWFLNPCNW